MKRTILTAMLLLLVGLAEAQTNSAIVELNLANSANEMARVCQIGGQDYLMCYSEHSGRMHQQRFTLINVDTDSARSFVFNAVVVAGAVQNGVTGRTVSDMCTNEGYCYFCGKETYLTNGISSSRGYVGRFMLADVLVGSGSVEIVRVNNTTNITDLAVSGSSLVQVFAIANAPQGPSFMTWDGDYNTSCLVEIDYDESALPNYRWSSYIVAPIDRDEVFTDIDMLDYGVGVVSRFRGGHQKFCVRNMKDGNGAMVDGDNWTDIQTANVFQNTDDDRTCRRESDKLFIGGGTDFFVAHSVDSNSRYGVAVYRMSLSNEPAQVDAVATQYWQQSVYESLIDLGLESLFQTDFLTRAGSVCYIHNTDNGSPSNTQFSNIATRTLSSISTSNSGYYYAVGHDALGKFVYCKQRKLSINSSSSCLSRNRVVLDLPSTPLIQFGNGLWVFQDKTTESVIRIPFSSSVISGNETCNF